MDRLSKRGGVGNKDPHTENGEKEMRDVKQKL